MVLQDEYSIVNETQETIQAEKPVAGIEAHSITICHVCLIDHSGNPCEIIANRSTPYDDATEYCGWCLMAYNKRANRKQHYMCCNVRVTMDQPMNITKLTDMHLDMLGMMSMAKNPGDCIGCAEPNGNNPKHHKQCPKYLLTGLPMKGGDYHAVTISCISLLAARDNAFMERLRAVRIKPEPEVVIDKRAVFKRDDDREDIECVPLEKRHLMHMPLEELLAKEYEPHIMPGLFILFDQLHVDVLIECLKNRACVKNGTAMIVVLIARWANNHIGAKLFIENELVVARLENPTRTCSNGEIGNVAKSTDSNVLYMRLCGRKYHRGGVNSSNPVFYHDLDKEIKKAKAKNIILLTDAHTYEGKLGASAYTRDMPVHAGDKKFERNVLDAQTSFILICSEGRSTKMLPDNFGMWVPRMGLHMSSIPWMMTTDEYQAFDVKVRKWLYTKPTIVMTGKGLSIEKSYKGPKLSQQEYTRALHIYDSRLDPDNSAHELIIFQKIWLRNKHLLIDELTTEHFVNSRKIVYDKDHNDDDEDSEEDKEEFNSSEAGPSDEGVQARVAETPDDRAEREETGGVGFIDREG